MIFLSSFFLWALISVGVPILIALMNRREKRKVNFGGFYLLKRLQETHKKRIQIFELLKLLNRILLLSLLVLVFSEPARKVERLEGASEGFGIILDVGRSMQATTTQGGLAQIQLKRLREILKQMPSQTKGSLLMASDRCTMLSLRSGVTTASADQWLDFLNEEEVEYANAPTLIGALQDCLKRVGGLFQGSKPYVTFLSPLPNTLDEAALKSMNLNFDALPQPEGLVNERLQVGQTLNNEILKLKFNPIQKMNASLIKPQGVENLGEVSEGLDLTSNAQSWLWLQGEKGADPWQRSWLVELESQKTQTIYVWAQKDSPGFTSLVAALKSHPRFKIIREVGGEPSGDPLIIYGSSSYPLESLKRVWFFMDPQGIGPFKLRDQKQWSASFSSPDLMRSFHIETSDGQIFIKKYALLDLDQFDILETFQDGAPSLLGDKRRTERTWISPFDLEDLTTDLTLEATFIPYLYRKLDAWLKVAGGTDHEVQLKPLWLMPGAVKPSVNVLRSYRWPGIYSSGLDVRMQEPVDFPSGFLKAPVRPSEEAKVLENVSDRPWLLKLLALSVLLELMLCLMGARGLSMAGIFLILMSSHLQAGSRDISIGYFRGMDADRKVALEQMVEEVAQLSNLRISKPEEVRLESLWKYALVVGSSTKPWGPFNSNEKDLIREYLERGGLLLFDDPLAMVDTQFATSVRTQVQGIFPGRNLSMAPKESVLFRTYYLLDEVSGRKLASPQLEGLEIDRRWVVVFSSNDLLGANLKSANGDYALSVSPYGIQQRTLARRLFLNLLMYSVTLDYKDDAIHLPHILKRRVK